MLAILGCLLLALASVLESIAYASLCCSLTVALHSPYKGFTLVTSLAISSADRGWRFDFANVVLWSHQATFTQPVTYLPRHCIVMHLSQLRFTLLCPQAIL